MPPSSAYFDLVNRRGITISSVPITPIPSEHLTTAIAIVAVSLAVTWSCVLLRFFTRYTYVSLGKDDFCILVTMIVFSCYCGGVIAGELRIHDRSSLPNSLMVTMTNILLIDESFYVWTMMMLKLALAFFFLRLLQYKWQQRIGYMTASFSILFGFAYFLYGIFLCGRPGPDYWIKKITDQCSKRASVLGFGYAHAISNAITDMILVSLPIPVIWKAKINRKEKIIVCLILLLAVVGSIASWIRVQYVAVLAETNTNFWIDIQGLLIWSTIEPASGITACSLATLRPLLKMIRSSNSSRSKSTKISPSKTAGSTTFLASHKSDMPSNFLLSATNPDSALNTYLEKEDYRMPDSKTNHKDSYHEHDRTHDRKKDIKHLSAISSPAPQISLPPIFHPQLHHPQALLNTSNKRASWMSWNSSWNPTRASRQTPSITNMATRGSDNGSDADTTDLISETTSRWPIDRRNASEAYEPRPLEPVLQDGYRRWVIDRERR